MNITTRSVGWSHLSLMCTYVVRTMLINDLFYVLNSSNPSYTIRKNVHTKHIYTVHETVVSIFRWW